MFNYLKMMRPLNCLMSGLAVFVGGFVVLGFSSVLSMNLYLASLITILLTGAGNGINDYFDIEADKINKPKRPLASGKIGKGSATAFIILLFIIGISLSFLVNTLVFMIAILNTTILIIYSYSLQNKIFLGNLAVSYLVASTFLFGGAAVGNIRITLILSLLAGLANISREIVKDIEDIEGDKKSFLKKLTHFTKEKIAERFNLKEGKATIKYGKRNLLTIASLALIIDIVISPLPYMIGIFGLSYLFVLFFADLLFALSVVFMIKSSSKKTMGRVSKNIKIGMFISLIAFVTGALF